MTGNDDRDPVVARALALLPVAEHQPGFWARLDRSLEAVDAERGAAGPAPDVTVDRDRGLAPVVDLRPPRRSRRPPRRIGWTVAAAGLVVLAVAGGVIARNDGSDVGVTTSPTTGVPGAANQATTVPPDTTARPISTLAVEPRSAGEAVLAWVDALGAGDRERAASLLGPGSLDHIGSLGREPIEFMTELSEGYGAWSAAADRSTSAVTVLSGGEGTVEVVVLVGTVEQEGMTRYRTVAVPVRATGGVYRVEPLDFGAGETRIEFVSPAPGPDGLGGLPADGVIELFAPGADQVAVSLDGGEVHAPAPAADGRVRFDPPGEMSSGTHVLVVASMGPDHLTAVAVTFLVEG